jgi:hypothetical protein
MRTPQDALAAQDAQDVQMQLTLWMLRMFRHACKHHRSSGCSGCSDCSDAAEALDAQDADALAGNKACSGCSDAAACPSQRARLQDRCHAPDTPYVVDAMALFKAATPAKGWPYAAPCSACMRACMHAGARSVRTRSRASTRCSMPLARQKWPCGRGPCAATRARLSCTACRSAEKSTQAVRSAVPGSCSAHTTPLCTSTCTPACSMAMHVRTDGSVEGRPAEKNEMLGACEASILTGSVGARAANCSQWRCSRACGKSALNACIQGQAAGDAGHEACLQLRSMAGGVAGAWDVGLRCGAAKEFRACRGCMLAWSRMALRELSYGASRP